MGFISKLFGGSKEDKALREVFEKIRRILEDEELQLEMINPAMKAMIESRPAYDRDPNGTGPFGFSEANPIPVNGPIGQLAYLSKLETDRGERILFHRIGAVDTIDVFEAVTFSGSEWFILFVDLYHPRRSRLTPDGFRFTQEVGQFSGFHKFCTNFPYDFVEMKQSESESGLSMAYIAISKVDEHIRQNAYQRPLAHKAKLDIVNTRLTSVQTQ
ncbi:MAG: hypothetical protein DRR42_22405 [Gammaproteobacteria bacterium]|nr:MAG: hypothetical protein DRR42_22405 [Gammaproteobacteria bacterium]